MFYTICSCADPRAHVHYVVTENGVANLYGKTIKERVKALVKIAHPNHQEEIDKRYFELIKGVQLLK